MTCIPSNVALDVAAPMRPIHPLRVAEAVLTVTGSSQGELVSRTRSAERTANRGLLVAALRELTELSYPEIAALCDRSTHSVVWMQHQRWLLTPREERVRQMDAVIVECCRTPQVSRWTPPAGWTRRGGAGT